MNVIAVIGDIVSSKELARRGAFQRRLGGALAAVGGKGSGVASPYTITLGDEFQAVYRHAGTLWADLISIMADIHPVRVRFALGVGRLATRVNPKQALGMDGPAFHHARAAINQLKGRRSRMRIVGDEGAHWALANHLLTMLSHQWDGWSRNRQRVLLALLRGQCVREIGAELNISKVAIYKNINAASLDEIAATCHELGRVLDAALA